MKKMWKKVVAVICLASMLITGIGVMPEVQASAAGFTNITVTDFGMKESNTYNTTGDLAFWNFLTNEETLDKKTFRAYVTFPETSTAFIYGGNSDTWGGLWIRPNGENGELVMQANVIGVESISFAPKAGQSFVNQSVLLTISAEITGADVVITAAVDDSAEQTMTIAGAAASFGKQILGYCPNIGGLKLKAYHETAPEGLTKLGWKDFGVTKDSTYTANGDMKSLPTAVEQTNMSFRGKVKFNRTNDTDAPMISFGENNWAGMRVVATGENSLQILGLNADYSTGLNRTITKADVEIPSFVNQVFELGLDIWEDGTNLKIFVYINGTQANLDPYVWENGSAVFTKRVCISTGANSSVTLLPDAETSPEGLTKIGWKDFGIKKDLTCATGTEDIRSLHTNQRSQLNVSFRGKVKFNRAASSDLLMLAFASTGWDGLRVTQTGDDKLTIQGVGGTNPVLAEITPQEAGVTSFANQEFELGLDIWSENAADVKVLVFVNGMQATKVAGEWKGAVTNGYLKKGLCGIAQNSSSIVITPENEPSPEGLTKVDWKAFGIKENKTCATGSGDVAALHTSEVSMIDVSFRGKVRFNRAADADLLMLTFASTGWDGLRVIQTADDKLSIQGVGGTNPVLAEIAPQEAGVTSFANQEFELGLDIWSENAADLKVNVFVNGVQATRVAGEWIGAVTNGYMKKGLYGIAQNSSSIVIIPEIEPSPEGLTKIGWKDFGITEDQTTFTNADSDGGLIPCQVSNLTTLIGTSFRGVISFNKAEGSTDNLMLCYGDTGWNWMGIRIIPTAGALTFQGIDLIANPNIAVISVDEIEELTSFLNQEFELGIDLWEESGSLKMNVFINGIQVTHTASTWENAVTKAYTGNWNNMVISGTNDSITVELPVEEACNLDTTPAGYLLDGSTVRVNDNAAAAGVALTTEGDYHVLYVDENGVTAKDVGCYKTGDAHVDGIIDIRDVVATEKVVTDQNVSSVARKKAADVNEDTLYNDADKEAIFNMILGVSTDTPNVASYSLTADALEMPIGGFNGPYRVSGRDLITDDIYKKIADCGINFITFTKHSYPTDSNDTENIEITQKQLALAEKYDLGFFVQDHHIQYSTQEWTTEGLANRIKLYSNYKSFRGLAIFDEPTLAGVYGSSDDGAGDAFNTRKSVSKLANSFSNIAAYANMLPLNKNMKLDTSVTDEDAYRTYLTTYCEEYNPKFLSYDNYPFEWSQDAMKGTPGKADYYYFKNLAIVREIANQYQIPFWTHVQSGDYFDQNAGYENKHNPSEGKFKWQINVELAFGAKGIQYFPLVQPDGYETTASGTTDYTRNGLIGKDGNTTEWYTYAQEMNQQIKNIDHVLMNSVSKGIMATGDYASANMDQANQSSSILLTEFDLGGVNPKITTLTTTGTTYGAIAGCFDYQGKAAVYVLNYDVEQARNVTLGWNKSCSYKVLDRNGETAKEPATECTLALGAGEAALLVFE